MRQIVFLFSLSFLPLAASADDAVNIGDIWYNLDAEAK